MSQSFARPVPFPARRQASSSSAFPLEAQVIPFPPWREESTPHTFANTLCAEWLPDFARITGACNAYIPQMKSIPWPEDCCNQDPSMVSCSSWR